MNPSDRAWFDRLGIKVGGEPTKYVHPDEQVTEPDTGGDTVTVPVKQEVAA